MKRLNVRDIISKKGKEKIVAITAYDALFANLFDESVDIILVGDSLNMSFNASCDTLGLSVDDIIYHSKAVMRAVKHAYVVADMPFGSYYNEKTAIKNALRIVKETGVDAVKLEGGSNRSNIVKALVNEGISVMGHIGLMPQSVRLEGGYLVKGKDKKEIDELIKSAMDLQSAGAMSIVIEGSLSSVAYDITQNINIPTIGIGAGLHTDGQILVFSDMLGFFEGFKPKFVKHYLNGAKLVRDAIAQYAKDVKNHTFPDIAHEYH